MSIDGTYAVSWALQQEAAGDVATAIGGMDAQLDTVNGQVSGLVATWDSEAQQAYHARQLQWNTAADNIKSALATFQAALNSAADTSQSTERQNVGLVSS